MTTGFAETGTRERTRTRRLAFARTRWFRLTTQLVLGGGVLVAVVARVGTKPFVHGLLSLDARSIGGAVLLCAVATGASAWRWQFIAGRLGVGLPWTTAVALYYRSQFLNSVLPGGVLGDADRAVTHGRSVDSIGRASRAIVIERSVGQAVQVALALVVLAFFGREFEGIVLAVVGAGLAVLVVPGITAAAASARVRRALRHERDELRAGLGTAAGFIGVAFASAVVVACHVAILAIATNAVGAHVPPDQLVPVALVVLLAASIPFNVGGWGPREGAAGWAFAVAGLGASAGVAASTLYGVLTLISLAPGAIVFMTHRKEESS
ncbi:lysylphosphatidylglycerol synthase transmembrane domain-containing protein [Diaminobutyricibacter tongyongensis]|nr:lysylphosphatidylglycerol synthase transmembrane domain-containing protein [Diaminobutyricibacter tongyongensis]